MMEVVLVVAFVVVGLVWFASMVLTWALMMKPSERAAELMAELGLTLSDDALKAEKFGHANLLLASVARLYDPRVEPYVAAGHLDRDVIEQLIANGIDPELGSVFT